MASWQQFSSSPRPPINQTIKPCLSTALDIDNKYEHESRDWVAPYRIVYAAYCLLIWTISVCIMRYLHIRLNKVMYTCHAIERLGPRRGIYRGPTGALIPLKRWK